MAKMPKLSVDVKNLPEVKAHIARLEAEVEQYRGMIEAALAPAILSAHQSPDQVRLRRLQGLEDAYRRATEEHE